MLEHNQNDREMTYMIELTRKGHITFTELGYTQHRLVLADLMSENIVLNYAESKEKDKFWIILEALSETDAIEIVSDLPILKSLKLTIIPLFTHVSNLSTGAVYSLN